MNGIEKINARLISDAQAEIDAQKAENDALCAEILKEYEAKAAQVYAERVAHGRSACEARAERMAAAADMEQRKATLAFKQEMVGEAFAKAVDAIAKLPKDEYVDFLARLMAEAAMNGEEEVLFSESDRAAVGSEAVKKANSLIKAQGGAPTLSLSAETAEIPGGFIMRCGNIEINCALDTLVMMQRASLSSQIAEILFS